MRTLTFGLLVLLSISFGCDSADVQPPPGADDGDTTLDVDLGDDVPNGPTESSRSALEKANGKRTTKP